MLMHSNTEAEAAPFNCVLFYLWPRHSSSRSRRTILRSKSCNRPSPVLVDFWAEWCGPCKMIAPLLDELADEYNGKVKIGKVNIDEHQSLAAAIWRPRHSHAAVVQQRPGRRTDCRRARASATSKPASTASRPEPARAYAVHRHARPVQPARRVLSSTCPAHLRWHRRRARAGTNQTPSARRFVPRTASTLARRPCRGPDLLRTLRMGAGCPSLTSR